MAAPGQRETSWNETLALIESDDELWVRMAGVLSKTAWQVRLMDIIHGLGPPGDQPGEWLYDEAHLLSFSATGDQVSHWLRTESLLHGSHSYTLPPQHGSPTIRWERKSSRDQPWFQSLDWPTEQATLPAWWDSPYEPRGPLVTAGTPSFISLYHAAAAFFGFRHQLGGGQVTPKLSYRHVDRAGRIRVVRIASDYIDVEVEGDRLTELTLELAGDYPGGSQPLSAESATEAPRFTLPDGLPSGAWVLLKTGNRWIDRRFLTYPFSRGTSEGVALVIDPLTRLEAFLAARERHGVEFKVKVPKSDEEKLGMFKTVAAFANEDDGGSVLVGVSDDRELVGIDAAKVDREIDSLTQMLRTWVTPPPPHSFERLPFGDGGKVIIELQVEAGEHLYAAGKQGLTIYVRPFSTTEKARPSEIEDLARRRLGLQQHAGLAFGNLFG